MLFLMGSSPEPLVTCLYLPSGFEVWIKQSWQAALDLLQGKVQADREGLRYRAPSAQIPVPSKGLTWRENIAALEMRIHPALGCKHFPPTARILCEQTLPCS